MEKLKIIEFTYVTKPYLVFFHGYTEKNGDKYLIAEIKNELKLFEINLVQHLVFLT